MPEDTERKTLDKLIEEADEIFNFSKKREYSRPIYKKALRKAGKLNKKLEMEYIQGKMDLIDEKFDNAIKRFDKTLKHDKSNLNALIGKGRALYGLGRYEESLNCYDKALKLDPKFAYALIGKGRALYGLGRYEEALNCYDKALKLDPKFAYALIGKGHVLYGLGRYEEALNCYDTALELDPEDVLAQDNKNLVLMRIGRFDEAWHDRKKVLTKIESLYSEEERKERSLEVDAQNEVIEELRSEYKSILDAKKNYESQLANSLRSRQNPLKDNFFTILMRWNSYTPTIHTSTKSNLGGGYFLYWKGKGIVIDPGFNFLDNFFNNGLLIHDIDAVIITHAHIDHCNDFESLLTLIYEYNAENEVKKKIDVFMNLGAMKKFLGWIPIEANDQDFKINHIYSLEQGNTLDLKKDYNMKIKATKAIHNEILSKTYSVGIILELYANDSNESKPFKIGYTSDTKHDKGVEEQYDGVDIIVPNLGSIEDNDFRLADKNFKRNNNHLMLKGVISTIYKSKAKLAIISEFGEELGEHRIRIVNALNRVFQDKKMARCLTGDIGLTVKIPNLEVRCHYCSFDKNKEVYVKLDDILEDIDPKNKSKKGVIYFCDKCKRIYEHLDREN